MSSCSLPIPQVEFALARFLIWVSMLINTAFIIDPTDTYFGLSYKFAYFPFLLFGFGVLLTFLTNKAVAVGFRFSAIDIFILGFLVVIITGSIVFSFQNSAENFLRFGLLGLLYFPAKSIFGNKQLAFQVFLLFDKFIFSAGLIVFSMLVLWRFGVLETINQANQNLFHEEVFLFACLPFCLSGKKWPRRLLLIIAVIGCLLTFKNTGFIVAATLMTNYAFVSLRGNGGVEKGVLLFLILTVFAIGAVLATAFWSTSLPDGNLTTRGITYGVRMAQIFQFPLFGNFFQMGTEINVGWGFVVSHSDLLDIIAGAGVLGGGLFFGPIIGLLSKPAPSLIMPRILVLAFLMVAAFNPIMMNPKLVFLFWLSLGFLSAHFGPIKTRLTYAKY